jgi:hypothetical protein
VAELLSFTRNDFVERAGVLSVPNVINDAHGVWPRRPTRTFGIDGHLEYATPEASHHADEV